jgi:hypothetical protein
MNSDRFDAVTRTLTTAGSRRRILATALGGLLPLGALPASARKGKKDTSTCVAHNVAGCMSERDVCVTNYARRAPAIRPIRGPSASSPWATPPCAAAAAPCHRPRVSRVAGTQIVRRSATQRAQPASRRLGPTALAPAPTLAALHAYIPAREAVDPTPPPVRTEEPAHVSLGEETRQRATAEWK